MYGYEVIRLWAGGGTVPSVWVTWVDSAVWGKLTSTCLALQDINCNEKPRCHAVASLFTVLHASTLARQPLEMPSHRPRAVWISRETFAGSGLRDLSNVKTRLKFYKSRQMQYVRGKNGCLSCEWADVYGWTHVGSYTCVWTSEGKKISKTCCTLIPKRTSELAVFFIIFQPESQ